MTGCRCILSDWVALIKLNKNRWSKSVRQSLLHHPLEAHTQNNSLKFNRIMAESPLSIIIKYCQSWGYRNAFVKTANYLSKYYPEAHIEGGLYPPPDVNQFIASVAQYLFFFGLILIFFGEAIAPKVNIPQIRELCTYISQLRYCAKLRYFIWCFIL